MTAPTLTPPKRVIDHWKSQGVSLAEIVNRCNQLGKDSLKRNHLPPRIKKSKSLKERYPEPWWNSKPGSKGLNKRLNREQLERLGQIYTTIEISRMFGVTPNTIYYYRRKWDIGR